MLTLKNLVRSLVMLMLEDKEIRVHIVGDAIVFYYNIRETVNEEHLSGKPGSMWRSLLGSFEAKKEELKKNPFYGIQIQKKLIPNKYVELYEVENLWKCNLALGWRAIYFIKGREDEIAVAIIDILSHKAYSKVFGYKNR